MADLAEQDQPDNTGGCMLALYPPPEVAEALTLPGGLPAGEIHLTVAYAGKAAGIDPQALHAAARQLAAREPVTATISGHARFTGGDTDVLVALADSPALEDLRRDTVDHLGAQGIAIPRDHGYTPHITRQYADAGDPDPGGRLAAFPVTFSALSVVHGRKRTDYPFADPLAERAREAYAAGWALSGGPMTDRVKAGCEAAVALALEHADDPHVLEVSLDLGSLQGTWAEVYRRREDLTAAAVAKVMKPWRKLVRRLDARQLLAAYRRTLTGTIEAVSPQSAAAARQQSLAWLYEILNDPAIGDLKDAVRAALADAYAEGKTAALAVAADSAKQLGFDWAKAYASIAKGLADLPGLPVMSDPWVQEILGAAAADVGRVLAAQTIAGASDSEILAAVMDEIDGADIRSVELMTDTAVSGSMARASLDLYQSEGLGLVAWLTAGDGRVCAACQDNEDNGPYDPAAFPACPDHPRCVIGSTRVAVPAGLVVTADVDSGLPGARVDLAADGASAPAATETGSDFGRGSIRAVSDREYVGDVITIRTALGYELTATPNHPVATRRGWVPIAELAVGDHVLASTRREWVTAAIDPDVDNVPPRVEQVAKSFPVQFGPMPTAAEDFHGDGAGSQVHVVRADGLLVDHGAPGSAEHVPEHQLGGRHVPVTGTLPFDPERPGFKELGRLRLAADSSVGRAGEPGTLLRAGAGHARVHGGAPPAGFNVGLEQDAADHVAADAEGFCESFLALAPDVAADEIVHVRREPFSGHVYNLDTVDGWYIGNGILTHNCRCTPTPASPLPVSAFADFLVPVG